MSVAAPTAGLLAIGWPFADGETLPPAWQALLVAHPAARPLRVAEQHRSGYRLADAPGATQRAEAPAAWRVARFAPEQRAAVGDWVLAEGQREPLQIVAVLPRRSLLKRGAAGEHLRVQPIAANVDTVFVVAGLDADFNPRRLERYVLLVRSSGAEPVIVLTKADKGGDVASARTALAALLADDVACVAINAKDTASVAQLAPWLAPGRSVALVGSSGAGKSTLGNTLLGDEVQRTGAVRASDGRGRHTTTHRSLLPLPGGACLVDTPGMRELKPSGDEHLEDGFADIEALAAECRFRDCTHAREPGCAVQAALAAGRLDAGRLANYRKLAAELAAAADTLAARQTKKSDERVQGRALNRRLDEKYGRH